MITSSTVRPLRCRPWPTQPVPAGPVVPAGPAVPTGRAVARFTARCCPPCCCSRPARRGRAQRADAANYSNTDGRLPVEHIGYARTLGVFRKASGFRYDEDEQLRSASCAWWSRPRASTAATRSRDEHLRGRDFLDAQSAGDDLHRARRGGSASAATASRASSRLLGQRRPLVLEATLNKRERYPIGPPVMKPVVLGASAPRDCGAATSHDLRRRQSAWSATRVRLIIELGPGAIRRLPMRMPPTTARGRALRFPRPCSSRSRC